MLGTTTEPPLAKIIGALFRRERLENVGNVPRMPSTISTLWQSESVATPGPQVRALVNRWAVMHY
jgi:hypothetical protein